MIESLPTTYSLENITRNLEYKKTSYEPEQFPGLIYKDWGVTFLLFSTGKIIITGIKNENIAPTLLERFLKLIQK